MAPKSRPPPSSEPDARPPSQPRAPPAFNLQYAKYPNPKSSSSSSSEGDSDSCSYSDSDSSTHSDSPPPPKPAAKAAPLNSAAARPVPPPYAAAAAHPDSPPPPEPTAEAAPLNSAAAWPVPPPPAAAAADSDSDSSANSDSPPPPKPAANAAPPNSGPATPAKRKLPAADDNLPSAKKLINHVWSTDDEILQGTLEIKSTHNSDPAAPIESFNGFITSNLNLEHFITLVSDKIRHLIGKYHSNLKQSKNGANPSFSRQIWSKNYEQTDGEEGEFRVLYPNLMDAIDIIEEEIGGIPAGVMRKSIEKLTPARVEAIEERWGKHSAATAKMELERADLIKDLIKAVVG